VGGVGVMESDHELKPKLSLELDQEKPPNNKKKSLWQKIKDFFSQEPEGQGSEKWRNRDPISW
jgi:hypothetical protein